MNEESNIPFYNDLLFKCFVYNDEDQDCMYLLKNIIETVTSIRCKELHVMNSELIPSRYGEKINFRCKITNRRRRVYQH